jgi:hypothetical protein
LVEVDKRLAVHLAGLHALSGELAPLRLARPEPACKLVQRRLPGCCVWRK